MSEVFHLVPKPAPPPKQSPVELLEEFIAKLRSGEIVTDGIFIFFLESLPNGNRKPGRWWVNLSTEERIALCELVKQMTIEEWRDPDL